MFHHSRVVLRQWWEQSTITEQQCADVDEGHRALTWVQIRLHFREGNSNLNVSFLQLVYLTEIQTEVFILKIRVVVDLSTSVINGGKCVSNNTAPQDQVGNFILRCYSGNSATELMCMSCWKDLFPQCFHIWNLQTFLQVSIQIWCKL